MSNSKNPSTTWTIIRLLGSLKLAVILLLTLAAAVAVATFLESGMNAAVARHYIYQAPWFAGWLMVLCLNLTCSALTRWPWKKKHIGFVVTHAGIIILLIGALIGRMAGFEANVRLRAGEPPTSRLIRGKEPMLQLSHPRDGASYGYPLVVEARTPSEKRPLVVPIPDSDWQVRVIGYQRALRPEVRLAAASASEAGAGMRVRLESSRMGQAFEVVLLTAPESARRVDLGPLALELQPSLKNQEAVVAPRQAPILRFAPKTNQLLVYESRRGKERKAAGTLRVGELFAAGFADWQVTLKEYVPRAEVAIDWQTPEASAVKTFSSFLPADETVEGIRVQLTNRQGEASEPVWIAWGTRKEIFLGDSFSRIGFGPRVETVPFGIALESMEIPRDEGGGGIADYIAHVRFEDTATGKTVPALAQMNEPANFPGGWWRSVLGRNYKFSQAGFDPEKPDETVLQVLYDPGWPAKWSGSLLICAGIAIMFYWKPSRR